MSELLTAVFAGGCFWCTEAIFQQLRGVGEVSSGYTGGQVPNPTYEEVCSGQTGHAEAIKIVYDPNVISYRDLLEVFFATHDPTTLNRQGNDIGTQYRSAIYFATPEQQRQAQAMIDELAQSEAYGQPIVTTVEPLGEFYPAEDYHKNYFANNGSAPYCSLVIAPKLHKFKTKFASLIKP